MKWGVTIRVMRNFVFSKDKMLHNGAHVYGSTIQVQEDLISICSDELAAEDGNRESQEDFPAEIFLMKKQQISYTILIKVLHKLKFVIYI